MVDEINRERRILLKLSLSSGLMSLLACGSMLSEKALAEWATPDFDHNAAGDIVGAMLDDQGAEESDLIQLTAPENCENNALVPVSFRSDLADLRLVTLLVDAPNPFAANLRFESFKIGGFSTRIRIERDSKIWVLAADENKFYISSAQVAVKSFQCNLSNRG